MLCFGLAFFHDLLHWIFCFTWWVHACSYCVMQLITVPESGLHLYYKKGRVGDDPNAEERLEDWENDDNAVEEFVRLFEEITGNEFEPWEREKKFQKKPLKFYPIDMVHLLLPLLLVWPPMLTLWKLALYLQRLTSFFVLNHLLF